MIGDDTISDFTIIAYQIVKCDLGKILGICKGQKKKIDLRLFLRLIQIKKKISITSAQFYKPQVTLVHCCSSHTCFQVILYNKC